MKYNDFRKTCQGFIPMSLPFAIDRIKDVVLGRILGTVRAGGMRSFIVEKKCNYLKSGRPWKNSF